MLPSTTTALKSDALISRRRIFKSSITDQIFIMNCVECFCGFKTLTILKYNSWTGLTDRATRLLMEPHLCFRKVALFENDAVPHHQVQTRVPKIAVCEMDVIYHSMLYPAVSDRSSCNNDIYKIRLRYQVLAVYKRPVNSRHSTKLISQTRGREHRIESNVVGGGPISGLLAGSVSRHNPCAIAYIAGLRLCLQIEVIKRFNCGPSIISSVLRGYLFNDRYASYRSHWTALGQQTHGVFKSARPRYATVHSVADDGHDRARYRNRYSYRCNRYSPYRGVARKQRQFRFNEGQSVSSCHYEASNAEPNNQTCSCDMLTFAQTPSPILLSPENLDFVGSGGEVNRLSRLEINHA